MLGVGAAAGGAGLAPWFDQTPAVHDTQPDAAGNECRVTYAAREIEDSAHPVATADRAAALAEAQSFLGDLDLRSISEEEAVANYRPAADEGKLSDEDLTFRAMQAEIEARMLAHLTAAGFSPHAVGIAGAQDCSPERKDR